jgi:pyruvate carboxylase subunit B
MFGSWKQIAPGYGKMVLGYFGRTPVEPDPEIVALAAQKLKLEPTTDNPLDIADADEKKSIAYWTKQLEEEGLETSEENIFIACAGDKKGIAFLKGASPLMVRKGEPQHEKIGGEEAMAGNYTVVVDGKQYSVQVSEGEGEIQVTPATSEGSKASATPPAPTPTPASTPSDKGSTEILSQTPGNVWKVLKSPGDSVEEGEAILILEAMKMEIEIASPRAGTLATMDVNINDSVQDGQLLATLV